MSGSVQVSEVRARLDEVVSALKEGGNWDIARPNESAFSDMGAFGERTMSFGQWLRWVFVPRVEQTIESNGAWPARSQVATRAAREADTDPSLGCLIEPLVRFDELFG